MPPSIVWGFADPVIIVFIMSYTFTARRHPNQAATHLCQLLACRVRHKVCDLCQ